MVAIVAAVGYSSQSGLRHAFKRSIATSPTAAVCCATKYAVRAISDGLRMENNKRVIVARLTTDKMFRPALVKLIEKALGASLSTQNS